MVRSEPTGQGKLLCWFWRCDHLYQRVCESHQRLPVWSQIHFLPDFFQRQFSNMSEEAHASQAGWMLFPRSSILESGPAGRRSVLQRAASPWEWWQLEPAGESCCILRCEGKAWTVHMLCHTVLPTAAGSFVVAVNALFLSFSPLKIREHLGLGCVRQSLPRMVGDGECGSDGSTHWGRWARVREPFKACG